jgi:hypothetical protein
MPSAHRKRGTSHLLVGHFPDDARPWWAILRCALSSRAPPAGDLVGPHENGRYVIRHAANTYTRTWATRRSAIHMSTTRSTAVPSSHVAEAAPGLDPLWVGSRFVDRLILGAVRWHAVPAVVELWIPLA